jgi:hypothetical protein
MTQFIMFIPQETDYELSEEHDQDGSIDCLLCLAAGGTDMEFVFDAVEQLLYSVFFAIVLEGFVK